MTRVIHNSTIQNDHLKVQLIDIYRSVIDSRYLGPVSFPLRGGRGQVRLVETSGFLTCLQLLQVVVTDLHVTIVFRQTLGEASGIGITLCLALELLLALLGTNLLVDRSGGFRGTTKHRGDTGTHGVTNGGTNGNTGGGRGHLGEHTWLSLLSSSLWVGSWVVWGLGVRWSSGGVGRSRLGSGWSRSGSSLSRHFILRVFSW